MDAPGATEASERASQARSEQDASASQSTSDERYSDDRPAPADDGHDDHNDEEAEEGGEEEADCSEEDEEDEEPRLKYAYLTKHLGSVYRNGDATSSFLTAGDKMV